MLTDLAMFLKDSWELIKGYPWTFIIFGLFCFSLGAIIIERVCHYFQDVKIHKLPEREELLKQVGNLKSKITDLEKQLRRQEISDLINGTLRNDTKEETIGEILSRNK